MKKTIRPILRDDLSRKGLEKRIDLRVYLDGRQTKFATPYSIAPACWDKKSGRVVGNCPEKSVINGYLNGKETEYERYLFQCEMLGETVDLERIREILTGKARTAPSEKTNATLDEIFDAYVDKLRTDNRCERTIIGILDLKKDMAKFSKRSKKRTIDQLDILFIQEYKKYLRTVRRNADNTINTKLNRLRSVVKWAGRLGYPIDDPFGKGLKFLNRSKPRTVFLTKLVRVGRLELPASCSQSKRATNCATPGYEIFQLWSNMWSTPIFDQLPARGKVLSAQVSQGFPGFPRATARTWASRSQMCVGTFSWHSTALLGAFLCFGSSSLTLFRPACFKKTFRLLGFVWDWILCIKRCSARGEWR